MARVSEAKEMELLDGEVGIRMSTNELIYRKGNEIISLTSDETRIELIKELVSHSLSIISERYDKI